MLKSLLDYINQQGQGLQGPLSDIAGLSPLLGAISPALGPIGAAAGLASLIPSLISAFSGRPKMEATSDISKLSGNADPVLSLLGLGAGKLGGNTPVSSPSAGPTFGPYFDVARKLEDLLRFGPGATAKDSALSATTLKQALTEAGNPGKAGNSTLQALQDAYTKGSSNLTPENISKLEQTMNPQEISILQDALNNPHPTNTTVIPQQPGAVASLGQALPTALAAAAPMLLAGAQVQNPIQPIQLNPKENKKKPFQLDQGQRTQQLLQLLGQFQ